LAFGDLKLFPLAPEETASVTLEPSRGFDVGAGAGKPLTADVKGGTVGLILDGRGRPLAPPTNAAECREAVTSWIGELDLYP